MTMTRVTLTAAAPALAGILLSACATGPNPGDPYEDFNRQMFAFNEGVDKAVIEPVAAGYRSVTTPTIREGVDNFSGNLNEPLTAVNHALQGKLPDAGASVGRFLINTTLGLAGLFDPASTMGLARSREDFGQTLGAWGIDSGPYIVLPFLGPSNLRDALAMAGDAALNPLNYPSFEHDDEVRIGIAGLGAISSRAAALEAIEEIRGQIDPYTTVRRLFDRTREQAVRNSAVEDARTKDVPESELDF